MIVRDCRGECVTFARGNDASLGSWDDTGVFSVVLLGAFRGSAFDEANETVRWWLRARGLIIDMDGNWVDRWFEAGAAGLRGR